MDALQHFKFIDTFWDQHILPTLSEYIKIPNKSPLFDREWQTHGYMDQAVKLITNWCETHAIPNMKLEVVRLENRTPVVFIEIPSTKINDSNETILLYGHLDKQPEMTGWEEGLEPWQPVFRQERLYGRGSADDGYAVFASLAAIKSLQQQHIPHARCIILIESCEESGSFDLPFYIERLKERIGEPDLVICLDSGCGNYDQLWLTTSLRGLIAGTLDIRVLTEGVHSGSASGIVPSCFRILRQLLNRIEDETTGDILLNDLHVNIPKERLEQAKLAAKVLGPHFIQDLPFLPGVQAEAKNISDLILRRTWHSALSVTGCNGLPTIENAGNVTLPHLSVKLSLRLPPTCDAEKAADALKRVFLNPPSQSSVNFTILDNGSGWNAPLEKPWLNQAIQKASHTYFGREAVCMGEGGSIPFMGMLGKKFPEAQFMITGLLGPGSNAHGPNEFLHIPTGKKLTAAVAHVISEHFIHSKS